MKKPDVSNLLEGLRPYVQALEADISGIPSGRRSLLEKVAIFVKGKIPEGEAVPLTFICTHNSRRSHFGQAWAKVAAYCYGLEGVETYSGGTEATAANPRTIAALQRAGFGLERKEGEQNPHYFLRYAAGVPPIEAFSKVYDAPPNPASGFVAVMACSQADENCPFIPGAALRVSLPYEDPKAADGSPQEAAVYDERCRQVAAEMFYLFSKV